MPVDERARHQLYRKLEQVLGSDEASTLIAHLPPVGLEELATREDLLILKQELRADMADLKAQMESLGRRLVMWSSSMVLAAAALAFAAGRFA